MPRVARSTDTTIDSLWPPTDPTGVVTVGIADLSGNLVTATATEPTIGNKDGLFEYKLAGDLSPDVDFRKVTWIQDTDQTQYDTLEVVGNHLFSDAAARSFKNEALSDAAKYPTPLVQADRDRITDNLETITGRSWIPRYRLMTFRGTGTHNLWLADFIRSRGGGPGDGALRDTTSILSATDQDGTINPDDIVIAEAGLLIRTDAAWKVPDQASPVNITLEIEYGVEGGYGGADRAAQEILVERLRNSNIPDRAISWTDEFGNIRLDVMPTQARDWIKTHDYRIKAF